MKRLVCHVLGLFQSPRKRIPLTFRLLPILVAALLALPSGILAAMGNELPGPQPNGSTLLINNWTITPAGQQTALGDLPVNAALSPDGKFLLVINSGAGMQSLQVVATDTHSIVQTIPYASPQSVFVGLAYSPDGTRAYASGGGSDVVHTYSVASDGRLTATGDIPIGTTAQNPFPTGLSVSPDGNTLYVANNLANTVSVVSKATKAVTGTIPVGSYPYTTLVSPDGKRLYVSNWGDATISVVNTATQAVTATIHVGNHPSAMAFGPDGLLFVADANSDAISVVDTAAGTELRRISDTLNPGAPLSTSPEGLGVSHDGTRLYVANAGNNDVAVFALHGRTGPETLLGRIPTAWYPTSVTVSPDDAAIFVTNAKGYGAGPNSTGYYPDPTRTTGPFVDGYCNCQPDRYTGRMIVGTLSSIGIPSEAGLALYSGQVERNDRVGSTVTESPFAGSGSPIKHVIYIIKENRTYDQVLGDEPGGNGDPSLTLFPRSNTPNIHALADRFGLLDNFYADAEVSADGHNWATSANATDYNEKMWPQNYSSPGRNRGYDFEGGSSINLSPGGYLWDAAAAAHVTLRDYGEFAQNGAGPTLIPESQADTCAGPIAHSYVLMTVPPGQVLCFGSTTVNPTTTPNLVGTEDPRFRGYDLRYHEADRVAEWQREFNQYVAGDNLPQIEIMRLPNDHTAGTRPGFPTPQAYVAENDWSVGKVADIVSHSKYWGSTAIFVTEDDAQNGPDHVDAHCTTSLVISPYTSHPNGRSDHTLYDTAAMVRTMELLLGLSPLSQYDAAAQPMWHLFDGHADLRPFDTLTETAALRQANSLASYGAQASQHMDFSVEDRAPMDALNRILWHAIKGAGAPYPARSGFVSH